MGRTLKYAVNNEQRMWITKLTKRASITDSAIQALEGLGIKFEEVKSKLEG